MTVSVFHLSDEAIVYPVFHSSFSVAREATVEHLLYEQHIVLERDVPPLVDVKNSVVKQLRRLSGGRNTIGISTLFYLSLVTYMIDGKANRGTHPSND